MARSQANDFLQNFRFHLSVDDFDGQAGFDPLGIPATDRYQAEAGFMNGTVPETSTEAVEYRDGLTNITMKQPTYPTVAALTFSRGVVMNDTRFLDWLLRVFDGRTYRADLSLYVWNKPAVQDFFGGFDPSLSRRYKILNAFPIRVKPQSDVDAQSGDIATAEIEFEYETYELVTP